MTLSEAFRVSFRLKNAYRVNGILRALKTTPVIKKLLPASLYDSGPLKTFANILSALREVVNTFLWKGLYFWVMLFLPLNMLKTGHTESFLHLFVFLTVIGGLFNTHLFEPSRDKYYAMFLMRMDARLYTLANYSYFLLKTVVGLLPVALAYGAFADIPLGYCAAAPFFTAAVKLCFGAFTLQKNARGKKAYNENLPGVRIIAEAVGLLVCAYLPPFFGWTIPIAAFWAVTGAALIGAVPALRYLLRFEGYRRVYQEILKPEDLVADPSAGAAEAVQKTYLGKLVLDEGETSKKFGYAYFNEIFMKRHRKLLTRSAKRITLIVGLIFAAAAAGCVFQPDIREGINKLLVVSLPMFLFIMYFINRGKSITSAMFMNCDHSMLTYRFYRQPKVILNLFEARLKDVIRISLMPAGVIALGLPMLLYLSGGTAQPMHYPLLALSILAMSVFFSVHNMVLYYLLQPYDVNLVSKNPLYSIADVVTYLLCYYAIQLKLDTLIFGVAICAFCLIYVAVALLLAYRLAPRTFHLRG